jgi:hypothetical protein
MGDREKERRLTRRLLLPVSREPQNVGLRVAFPLSIPAPVGCDRKSAHNPSITQAARDGETAESLGRKWSSGGPSV